MALTSSDQLYFYPKDTPAALGPPPPPPSPVYYCITNYDVVGGAADYGFLEPTGATGCASKCSGNPRCDFFVLTTPNPAEPRGCWPKTAAFTGDSGPMHLRLVAVLSCLSVAVYGEWAMYGGESGIGVTTCHTSKVVPFSLRCVYSERECDFSQ